MQISLKWIDELIDIKEVHFETLIKKLTLGGFEVEDIIETQVDTQTHITLDISATANRPDSLTIQGISSELRALLNQPLKDVKYLTKKFNWTNNFEYSSYTLSEKNACQTFVAVTLENVVDSTSPKWLQQKLICSGMTPENSFHDFQNYIQLETGYPFELYDLNKIDLKSNKHEFTVSLLNNEKLQKVFVNNVCIGIAGISPNDNVKCSHNTKKILLEGSIFKAVAVRQQSRLVGFRTDRSTRYEKSIKDSYLTSACYRLISLLRIKNPNLQCKLHTNSKIARFPVLTIKLRYSIIKEILGPIKKDNVTNFHYISPEQVTDYLIRLNFKHSYDPIAQTWSVTVSNMRSDDIIEEIDLVEEIGRLHGFENFLTQVPQIKRVGVEDSSYKARKKITENFLNIGLTECVHYSLVNTQRQNETSIVLINPLLSEYSNLRLSLLPNLIQTLKNNLNQGNLTIESFEYGHVFAKSSSLLINEKEMVAGIFGGTKMKSTWSTSSRLINWFEAKGRLEQVFKKLHLPVSWKPFNSIHYESMLHPYCTSQLLLDTDTPVGVFGQINPILARKLELPIYIYLFELDFEIIKKAILKVTMVMSENYSLYPKIVKDLSIIVPNDIKFEELKRIIYLNGSKFLTEINLVDEYNGKSIPKLHTSLCLQFVFQSNEQTLQSHHIEKIISTLKAILVNKLNVMIRH